MIAFRDFFKNTFVTSRSRMEVVNVRVSEEILDRGDGFRSKVGRREIALNILLHTPS
jgi:hypothetical protein